VKGAVLVWRKTATAGGESGFNHHLAPANKDLAASRERFRQDEFQLGLQN